VTGEVRQGPVAIVALMNVDDASVAVAAAQAGAAVVRARFGAALPRFEKSPLDFATAADIEAEEAILEVLSSARPGDAVLAEESGLTGPAGARRTWLVDPLCGTLNFAAQTTMVAVNVALQVGADLVAAAAADPFAGEVFWTDGARAVLRHGDTDEPLRPSAESLLVDLNLDPPFPNAPRFDVVRLLADPRFTERFRPRVLSTSLAMTWVAAGRRAAYITDGPETYSVHSASAIAICRAAGCVVTDLWGGPLQDGAAGLVVAADAETHAALLAAYT
jgi:myo-inositol-1(or 4)-monophosphatase